MRPPRLQPAWRRNAARLQGLSLASGSENAEIVAQMMAGPLTNAVPVSALLTHFNCVVVLDEAAGNALKKILLKSNLWLKP